MQSTSSDGDVVTTYDDPNAGIRLTYPGDWQEQSLPSFARPKGTVIVLTAPSEAGAMHMPPTLSVIAQDVAAVADESPAERLDGMQRQLVDRAAKQFENFQLIESASAMLGSSPARRVVYTGKKMGVNVKVMNVIAIHAGRQYALSYSADPEFFAAQRPAVEKVIETVQFAH